MQGGSSESGLRKILEALERHGVEYMLIGGQAEVLMGSPRVTYDTDLTYRRDPENLRRLAAALRELNARLRVGEREADLPFPLDERSLSLGNNFTFRTDAEDLDLQGYVAPIGEYNDLYPKHETYEVYGYRVRTIGLEDLLRVKEHIARKKDSESLHQLRAIRAVRQQDQA